MNQKLKKVLKFLAVATLSVFFFIAIAIGAFVYFWNDYTSQEFALREFNADYWHNPQQKFYDPKYGKVIEDWCLRGSMYSDLEKNYLPKLKTMDETIEFLGVPEYGQRPWGMFNHKKCLGYNLGSCILGSSRSVAMVCTNKEGKVIDYFRSDHNNIIRSKRIKEFDHDYKT